jgi:hypothetical protein
VLVSSQLSDETSSALVALATSSEEQRERRAERMFIDVAWHHDRDRLTDPLADR